MKFATRRDCLAWCAIANTCWLSVEKVTLRRFEGKLVTSPDPRMKRLATLLYDLANQYREGLRQGMLAIEQEDKESPCPITKGVVIIKR